MLLENGNQDVYGNSRKEGPLIASELVICEEDDALLNTIAPCSLSESPCAMASTGSALRVVVGPTRI